MSSRKVKHGKRVYYDFIVRDKYASPELYNEKITETINYLKTTSNIYTNNQIGIVQVFRCKRGARIIAYDLPDNS